MYQNKVRKINPGFMVFLIDQSNSMAELMPDGNGTLADNTANAINRILNELILCCTMVDGMGNEYIPFRAIRILIIGYGGNDTCVICDKWIDEIGEPEFSKVKSLLDSETDLFEVVKPTYGGGTPMASAFATAKDLVAAWIQTHNTANDPTPVIINITDGMPTDSVSELKSIAKEIMALEIPDGNPLIFNIHLSAKPNPVSIQYPNDLSQCTDEESKLLFELSSEITNDLNNRCLSFFSKRTCHKGSKLFLDNITNEQDLFEMLSFVIEYFRPLGVRLPQY